MASEPGKAIPEAVSEKRKRGRPRVIGPEAEPVVDLVAPDVTTERGRQDAYYRQIALGVLMSDRRFTWLADEAAMKAGAPKAWKPTILAELGRIPDDEAMKAVAAQVCELRPKAKAAVAMIRRYRLGREPEGTPAGLDHHLVEAVNQYWGGHTSLTPAVIVEVLRALADRIEWDHPCDE